MYFNNFFVENFVKYNAKVEKFMCSSIDSMLRYTKGKHQVQDIKPTTLQSITDVSSKALLLEPVCKVLFLNQNLQVGVKQMISIKSESAQENIKPKKVKEEGRLQELPQIQWIESEDQSDDIYQLQCKIENVKNESGQEDIR